MFVITDLASAARALYEGGLLGRVHSVYRSTVNLECAGALYALQPEHTPRTPLSVTVSLSAEEFSQLQLARGDRVTCGRTLQVGTYLFSLENAAEWNPRMAGRMQWDGTAPRRLHGVLRQELAAHRARGDFVDAALHLENAPDASECRRRATAYAERFYRYACGGQYAQAAEECAGLIGLGAGLTPAGDDFNVGVLAALWYFDVPGPARQLRKALIAQVGERCGGTNDVSRAFLRAAAAGEFSEPILALLEQGNMGEELWTAAEAALAVGHSSGLDTLCGLLLAMEALTGASNNSFTCSIPKRLEANRK